MYPTELIEAYTRFIKTTYPAGHTREQVICNCVLGVIGEFKEWMDTRPFSHDELHEAGDVLYYITMLADTLGLNIASLAPYYLEPPEDTDFLCEELTEGLYAVLTEATKKYLFYATPKYTDSEYAEIVGRTLASYLEAILLSHTLEVIMITNTEKLSERYGTPNPMETPQ